MDGTSDDGGCGTWIEMRAWRWDSVGKRAWGVGSGAWGAGRGMWDVGRGTWCAGGTGSAVARGGTVGGAVGARG